MNKKCKKCGIYSVKKNGKRNGKQRYLCKNCGYQWENKSKHNNDFKLRLEYVYGKQTLEQLGNSYGKTVKTIRKKLDSVHIKKDNTTTRNSFTNGYSILWKKVLSYGI